MAVDQSDVVVAGAGPDVVVAVARIDPIVAGTAVQLVLLSGWVVFGARVAPDHVALVARIDRVVAGPAEQLVVDAVQPAHDAAFAIWVPLVVADRRPAGMTCLASRGGGDEKGREGDHEQRPSRAQGASSNH